MSVLLVEDDREQSWIFTTFLKRKGLNVTSYSNSLTALEHFKANIDIHSIILTDFRIDKINGIDFAREIRKLIGNSIFMIAITAYSIRDFINEKEPEALIDRVVTKPFSLEKLDKILSYYLEYVR